MIILKISINIYIVIGIKYSEFLYIKITEKNCVHSDTIDIHTVKKESYIYI